MGGRLLSRTNSSPLSDCGTGRVISPFPIKIGLAWPSLYNGHMDDRKMTSDEISEQATTRTVGEYVLQSEIGKGAQSTVWKAARISNGQEVALKQVNLSKLNRQLKKCLDCELHFLSSVDHPNIIRLLDVFQSGDCIFLVLEFCPGGTLASFIHHHGRVQEQTARGFVKQLGAGLKILNSHQIIHRDLKPENILLSGSERDVVLNIADFGLSGTLNGSDYAETVCGSPLYMAPEVLQFQKYDDKIDMWSVGAILFELLNGFPPFSGRNNVQLIRNIKLCVLPPFCQLILPGLDRDCVDMCLRLLSTNPVQRLSFHEFYHHKFLKRKVVL